MSDYPRTEDGKFDAPNMTKDQVRLAKEYKYVLEQLAITDRYNYIDDINKINFNG
ncbi:MAG TPA: hypothetical protein PLP33_25955 [Leptospiraceae bacterium]|nr:hypothetical protein [Leptospiraceae bacterium]